jgi:hypothetical protein
VRKVRFPDAEQVNPRESADQNVVVMSAVGDAAVRYAEGGYYTIVEGSSYRDGTLRRSSTGYASVA